MSSNLLTGALKLKDQNGQWVTVSLKGEKGEPLEYHVEDMEAITDYRPDPNTSEKWYLQICKDETINEMVVCAEANDMHFLFPPYQKNEGRNGCKSRNFLIHLNCKEHAVPAIYFHAYYGTPNEGQKEPVQLLADKDSAPVSTWVGELGKRYVLSFTEISPHVFACSMKEIVDVGEGHTVTFAPEFSLTPIPADSDCVNPQPSLEQVVLFGDHDDVLWFLTEWDIRERRVYPGVSKITFSTPYAGVCYPRIKTIGGTYLPYNEEQMYYINKDVIIENIIGYCYDPS